MTFGMGIVVHPDLAAALKRRGRRWGQENQQKLREMRAELTTIAGNAHKSLIKATAHLSDRNPIPGGVGGYVRRRQTTSE